MPKLKLDPRLFDLNLVLVTWEGDGELWSLTLRKVICTATDATLNETTDCPLPLLEISPRLEARVHVFKGRATDEEAALEDDGLTDAPSHEDVMDYVTAHPEEIEYPAGTRKPWPFVLRCNQSEVDKIAGIITASLPTFSAKYAKIMKGDVTAGPVRVVRVEQRPRSVVVHILGGDVRCNAVSTVVEGLLKGKGVNPLIPAWS